MIFLASHSSDTRKRKVVPEYPNPLVGCETEQPFSAIECVFRVYINRKCPFRVIERESRVAQSVNRVQKPVPFGFEQERRVTGGVTGGLDSMDASHHFHVASEPLDSVSERSQPFARNAEHERQERVVVGLASGPERPISLVDKVPGVGKGRASVVARCPADVVGMAVRENDGVDGLTVYSKRAKRWTESSTAMFVSWKRVWAEPCVNQHSSLRGLDEVRAVRHERATR